MIYRESTYKRSERMQQTIEKYRTNNRKGWYERAVPINIVGEWMGSGGVEVSIDRGSNGRSVGERCGE